jgi:hypothetical protein
LFATKPRTATSVAARDTPLGACRSHFVALIFENRSHFVALIFEKGEREKKKKERSPQPPALKTQVVLKRYIFCFLARFPNLLRTFRIDPLPPFSSAVRFVHEHRGSNAAGAQ